MHIPLEENLSDFVSGEINLDTEIESAELKMVSRSNLQLRSGRLLLHGGKGRSWDHGEHEFVKHTKTASDPFLRELFCTFVRTEKLDSSRMKCSTLCHAANVPTAKDLHDLQPLKPF